MAKSRLTKFIEHYRLQEMWETIKAKPYHVDDVQEKEQSMAYDRLMDHVDGIENDRRNNCNYYHWKRAVSVFVFCGLTSALVVSLTVDPTKHQHILRQRVWQWIAMTMMLTAIFSVVPFLTFLLSWPFLRCFKTHKYVVYFLRGMKRSVDVTLWSCLVLLGWYAWFRPRLKHVHGDLSVIIVSQITRGLIALCIGSLLWAIKNGLYFKLEADLHYDQLFDRTTQTLVDLNGIQILDGKMIGAEFLAYSNKQEGNKIESVCTNIWMDVLRMKRERVPIWILHRLSEEYLKAVKLLKPLHADDLLEDDQKLLEEANQTLERIVGPNKDSDISRDHLAVYNLTEKELDYLFKRKPYQVERQNKIKQDREVNRNTHQAQVNVQTAQTREENRRAQQAEVCSEIATPRRSPDKDIISADDFLNWVVRANKNCWSLEPTLGSSKSAFVKLDRMLSAFLLVLIIIIWLLLSKIVNTAQLALLFAPFLAASFMFENSSKNMFLGIIFAFAMHPFDVGDRVIIEDTEMRVKVMHILTSVFVKYDTGAEVIFPNSKLSTTKIVNLDITPDQSDKLDFVIDANTPLEDVKDLELKIKKLLDDHRFYTSDTKVVKSSSQLLENPSQLKMTVHFKYLVSYLTAETKATRRSEILTMIMKLLKEMKENRKDFPLQYVTYDLQLTAPKNVKMSSIEHLKYQLLRRVEEMGYNYCKVVMTYLKDDQIKMALFVSKSKEDKSLEEANNITPELKRDKFFNHIGHLLSECGYTNLLVLRDEQTIYYQDLWSHALSRAQMTRSTTG